MNRTLHPKGTKISVGQKVHCTLHGGKDGIVVNIKGEQSPETVDRILGLVFTGGRAEMDVIWAGGSQSNSLPESLLQGGVQWRIYAEVASAGEIAEALRSVEEFQADAKAKAEQASRDYAAAKEAALTHYPYLTCLGPGEYGNEKFAAKNARVELKRAWPSVKFSVTSSHSTLSVKWDDGPTEHQVVDLVSKYTNGGFDSMQDMATSNPTAFTDLFGWAQYVSCRRSLSAGLIENGLNALYLRLPGNLAGIEKPSMLAIENNNTRDIPSLDRLTIGAAAKAIAAAWDEAGKKFVRKSRYSNMDWLVFDHEDSPQCQPFA